MARVCVVMVRGYAVKADGGVIAHGCVIADRRNGVAPIQLILVFLIRVHPRLSVVDPVLRLRLIPSDAVRFFRGLFVFGAAQATTLDEQVHRLREVLRRDDADDALALHDRNQMLALRATDARQRLDQRIVGKNGL